MPFLDVRGARLFYEVSGEGPPCLTLHGGLGFDHTYMRSLAPLEHSLRMVYFDQRGNGRSDRGDSEALTIQELAEDAAEVIQQLCGGSAIVLGHSFGGFVAQELAIRNPNLVRSLVLVDTTPGQLGENEDPRDGEGPPLPEEAVAIMSSAPESDEAFAAAMGRLFPHYFHNKQTAAAAAEYLKDTVFSARAMGEGFQSLDSWSSVDRLHQITVPTLLLWGREDLFTSLPQASRIAKRIPGATLEVFDGCGHFPWLEAPQAFFDTARQWLARQSTR